MAFIEDLGPYFCVLWGIQYVTPSFLRGVPEQGEILAFTQDIRQGNIPSTVEISPEWLEINDRDVPFVKGLDRALYTLPPGVSQVPDQTPMVEILIFLMVSINPLELVRPLPTSPFIVPANVCHLLTARDT